MNDMTRFVEENAVLARIYARLPVDVQLSLTPEQLAALGRATYDPPTPHKVAIRKTFRLFGKPFYLALFMGRDRRGHRDGILTAYANEFRADWRYMVGMLTVLLLVFGGLVIVAFEAWHQAAQWVGGPYRPITTETLKLW